MLGKEMAVRTEQPSYFQQTYTVKRYDLKVDQFSHVEQTIS